MWHLVKVNKLRKKQVLKSSENLINSDKIFFMGITDPSEGFMGLTIVIEEH